MGLFRRKKEKKNEVRGEWTSFEFVQFLIKYPDTSDESFVMMFNNLLGEDNLEKDMEDYWKNRLDESFISYDEFKKIKKDFNHRFKKIRKLSKVSKETEDLAKWAIKNTDDDRINDENI
jgi:hypothetical protein